MCDAILVCWIQMVQTQGDMKARKELKIRTARTSNGSFWSRPFSGSSIWAYPLDKYGRAFPFDKGPELTHNVRSVVL